MAEFFQQIWLLWWIVALVVVVRWFHVVSVDDAREDLGAQRHDESSMVPDR